MKPVMSVTYHAERWEFTDPAPAAIRISLGVLFENYRLGGKNKPQAVVCTSDGIITFNDSRGPIDYEITGWEKPDLVAALIGDFRGKVGQ